MDSDFGFTHSFTIKKQDTMSAYTGDNTCAADIFYMNYFKEDAYG